MNPRPWISAALALACVVTIAMKIADQPGQQMSQFATAFIELLDENEKAKTILPYDSPRRVQWHFIPKAKRKGLPLGEMNEAQRVAALRLVRSALSESGYAKANQIMMLESVLRILEGEKNGRAWSRDPHYYFVTLFGTPSDQGAWGLSFEGHHLSLNFSCRDGKVVDSTPQFLASNPAVIKNKALDAAGLPLLRLGTQVLRDEEEYGFQIAQSLSPEQLGQALIAEKAPREVRFAGDAQPVAGEPAGIRFTNLDKSQQDTLKKLVETYVSVVPSAVADTRRQIINHDGWEQVHFAWAGATEPGIGHYYRIQGKRFLIELVNTQPDAMGNPANHVHCFFRDLTGDFDLPVN